MSKGKSIKKKILESLKEKAKLNDNPGELIQSNKEIYSKKDRRKSGRVYPHSGYPQRVLEAEGLVLEQYWDDWYDYRDGLRDKKELSEKEVKKKKIRKARKAKYDSLFL